MSSVLWYNQGSGIFPDSVSGRCVRLKKAFVFLSALVFLSCLYSGVSADSVPVIVSLGDSYSCGEGIEPFYGQDAEMALRCLDPDWLAHRSEKSWPGMLTLPGVSGPMKEHRGENWFFAAASGADSSCLYLPGGEERPDKKAGRLEKGYNRDGISGTAWLEPQLDIFDELDRKGLEADYVTVTIGGNDLGFHRVIGFSLLGMLTGLPGDTPAEKADALLQDVYFSAGVRSRVKRAYSDIASRAGSQACILAVGYPPLLAQDCGGVFPGNSPEILNAAVTVFNEELRGIVDECRAEGLNICFVSVEEAFGGHEAYSAEPGINPLIFGAGAQDLKEFQISSSYSMHPNELGAAIYARCVQDVIDRLESEKQR